MADYWFFLSYARRDGMGDEYLKRFVEKLSLAVARAASVPSTTRLNEIRFFSETSIETGDKWDDDIEEALGSAKVFVCLYSRSYFKSEYCGKELAVFLNRLNSSADRIKSSLNPHIIPILWDRPRELPSNLPAALSKIQYTHEDFGDEYANKGLDLLIRQEDYKSDYENFVIRLADKIVEVGKKHRIPNTFSIPAIETVQSAFHAQESEINDTGNGESNYENTGPEFAHFAFIAGRKGELRTIKKQVDAYSEKGGRHWSPYIPQLDASAGLITMKIAVEEKLQPEIISLQTNFITKLKALDETNTVVVIVVDPWTATIQTYKEYLETYDSLNFINCGVIVLWNEKDEDLTGDQREQLREKLSATFKGNVINGNACYRDGAKSPEEMEQEIKALINKVRSRLMQRAKMLQPKPVGDSIPLSRISASGAGI